jgi:multidrug transporter EmrE-like cation transporter
MREAAFLVLAAILEVGGDALTRWGLKSGRWTGLALGAAVLFGYGLSVNLPKWDFGRLIGVYIAVFFVVAQIVAVAFFRERVPLPTILGGALIVAGGILITVWRVPQA